MFQQIINASSLYCVGDIHGEFNGLLLWVRRYDLKDACLVFCGDIGLGFCQGQYYKNVFTKLNRECKKRNVTLVLVRGNHDDPTYFTEQKIRYSHIVSVPDYTILSVANHWVLCVGGGVSVDRTARQGQMLQAAIQYARFHGCSLSEAKEKASRCYWQNEMPIFSAVELDEIKQMGIRIDVVCTHTAPSFVEPHIKDGISYWLNIDSCLNEDIQRERETMDRLWERLIADHHPLRHWCYGHYHYHHTEEYEGVCFCLLDMCHHSSLYDMVQIC